MHASARIYVAGGQTLLGAALVRRLQAAGFEHLAGPSPHEPDLANSEQVDEFFQRERPEYVFVAAGLSGGIEENRQHPADLMLDNLTVATHVLPAAFRYGARKLLYLATSCCYPKDAPHPLAVESLMSGPLEATSAAYATAKLAGLALCRAFRQQYGAPFSAALSADLFGPGDDFHADTGHVIPALMRRMHVAARRGDAVLPIWGSGQPRRDFLYVDDAADACLFLMRHYDDAAPINIGSGRDLTIADTARTLADVVGYRGRLLFDTTRPDGAPRKLLDAADLFALGWRPRTEFRAALEATYAWFVRHEVTEDGHARAAV
jgi:GDP-L-fucose synthase